MRHSIFPSDDSLPTWLHTTLLVLVVSPFCLIPLWWGIGAMVLGHLDPLPGPDFGGFFFGQAPLYGGIARFAGFALVILGVAFAALAARYSRFADENKTMMALPWVLIACFIVCSFLVNKLA